MPSRPIPKDVKLALAFMRASLHRSVALADIVRHCGVAERTLNQHFRAFLGAPPMRYLRRLRLAAARKTLLSGESYISVTEITTRYAFNHFGRFSAHYREVFGETPSTTLRRARAARLLKDRVFDPESEEETGRPLFARSKPSIAILPFQAPKYEPALNWLTESIGDAIAVSLGAANAIEVKVAGGRQVVSSDLRPLARELGTRYFLMGRIEKVGARLRVILRIVDSTTCQHVWGDSFDGEVDRALELQDRINAGILRTIVTRVRDAEIEGAWRTAHEDLDAYGLAMRALPLVFESRPESATRALGLLNRALEIDADYSLVPALAAWCHGQLVMFNGSRAPAEEKAQALQLMHRVAAFDDDDPLVLAARCAVHTMAGEFDAADALISRALAHDPTFGWAWGRSGWLNSYRGNTDKAIEHFHRAISLDPHAYSKANSLAGMGCAHFNAERYEAAAFWLQSAIRANPGLWWANRSLSVSYARLGNRREALESLATLRRHCPDATVGKVIAAVPFGSNYLSRLGEGLSELGLPP